MNKVKIAELRDHLSEHLRAVERGAEVTVMDRNRPIARILPMPQSNKLQVISATRDFKSIVARRRRANWEINSTALLLEERGER
ncbi:MAG: type II toxin-antitoxin system prevent-host-death family antitoxin [Actinomycetota bacterium]